MSRGSDADADPVSNGLDRAQLPFFRALAARIGLADRKTVGSDVVAGLIAGTVLLFYCVSYTALLFPGALRGGLPVALWALLAGVVVTSAIAALSSSIPPIVAGPDTAGVAMMSVLGATISAQVLQSGGTPDEAVQHALLAFTLTTAATSLLLLPLGVFRLSHYVRYVPFPVASGFIGATGALMVLGSLKVLGSEHFSVMEAARAISIDDAPRLLAAGLIGAALILARRMIRSSLAIPAIFIGACATLDGLLWLTPYLGSADGWFLGGVDKLSPWLPIQVALDPRTDWSILASQIFDILAIAGVMVVALVVKVSGLEVSRSTVADLDHEFRIHGVANLVAATAGGIAGSVQFTPSRVLVEAGGRRPLCGLVAALVIAVPLLTRLDILSVIPTPALSGLLVFLGYVMLADTLGRPSAQHSYVEFGLILVIMFICVRFGYPAGVLVGFLFACILFVFRYSRIGVLRRHLTRSDLSTSWDRAPEETRFLRESGDAIHIYFLAGYMFFGSSEALFETICRNAEAQKTRPVRFIVLDFTSVTGVDTSAASSLSKLTIFCNTRGIVLVYAGLSMPLHRLLERGRFFGGRTRHKEFDTRNDAVEWCEEALLADAELGRRQASKEEFEQWLVRSLGPACEPSLLSSYFERRELPAGMLVYQQGEPSDTIDIVAAGAIAISMADEGRAVRMRRMSHKTVVGEMGFFRNTPRAANVTAETDTVLYTLTREGFERMLREAPELATAFLQFIIRALSERVEFSNHEIVMLS